jgi:hypothetical protein
MAKKCLRLMAPHLWDMSITHTNYTVSRKFGLIWAWTVEQGPGAGRHGRDRAGSIPNPEVRGWEKR